jgi:hypothetical protein
MLISTGRWFEIMSLLYFDVPILASNENTEFSYKP